MALFRLGRWSKDRLRQRRGELQARRQFDSANALRLLILLPAGAGQITAHDAFHREWCGFAHNHGTTSQLVAKFFQLRGIFVEIHGNEVTMGWERPDLEIGIRDVALEMTRWSHNMEALPMSIGALAPPYSAMSGMGGTVPVVSRSA